MLDIVFVGAIVLFFSVAIGYVQAGVGKLPGSTDTNCLMPGGG